MPLLMHGSAVYALIKKRMTMIDCVYHRCRERRAMIAMFVLILAGTLVAVVPKMTPSQLVQNSHQHTGDGLKQQVVFDLRCDGSPDLYVMDSSGANARRLTHESDRGRTAAQPVWAPDGEKIAFTLLTDMPHRAEVYVVNSDGSGLAPLTQTSGAASWHPTWSPDGRRLIFESNRDENTTDLYMMNADGTGLRRLTHTRSKNSDFGQPAWSPDGGQVAFDSYANGPEEIFVMDLQTMKVHVLTQTLGGKESWNAAWSPDGGRIVFGSNRDGADEVYTMNASGGDVRRLHIKGYRPRWSPDGKRLVYMAEDDAHELQIFTAAADGSDVRRLTQGKCEARHPDWCCRPLASSSH